MANTNTITQNTATIQRVAPIFADKVLESVTMNLPGVQMVAGSRDKFAMVTGSVTGAIQNYSDKPSADGTTSLIDTEFTISGKSIFHEVAYSKFANTKWKSAVEDMKAQRLPQEFVAFILDQQAKISGAQFEDEFWNGNGGLTDDLANGTPAGFTYCNGVGNLVKAALTSASKTSQIITQTTSGDAPTDATKVQAEFASILAVAPKALIGGKGTFFVSPVVEAALYQSYANQAATNIPQTNSLMFNRHNVVVIPNLNDNRIIFGLPENLGIGSAFGESNLLDLQIVDKYSQGDGNFAVVTANYGYGAGAVTTDWVSYEYDPV